MEQRVAAAAPFYSEAAPRVDGMDGDCLGVRTESHAAFIERRGQGAAKMAAAARVEIRLALGIGRSRAG